MTAGVSAAAATWFTNHVSSAAGFYLSEGAYLSRLCPLFFFSLGAWVGDPDSFDTLAGAVVRSPRPGDLAFFWLTEVRDHAYEIRYHAHHDELAKIMAMALVLVCEGKRGLLSDSLLAAMAGRCLARACLAECSRLPGLHLVGAVGHGPPRQVLRRAAGRACREGRGAPVEIR